MELTFTNLLLLAASIIGLFLSVLIFNKFGYSLANRLLALLLLLYAIVLIRLLLWDLGYFTVVPHLLILPISISFLMGPVHYLYCKYLIDPQTEYKKKDYLHFIPFLIYQIVLLKELFKSDKELINSLVDISAESISGVFLAFNWIITIHVLFYVTITLLRIQKYSSSIKQVFSSIEKLKLNWLWYITLFIGLGMVVFLIENTFLLGGYIISDQFELSNIIFSVYVVAIGYLGMLKSDIFLSKEFSDNVNELENVDNIISKESTEKYRRSGLTEERANAIIKSLSVLMQNEMPYMDSTLTLNKLAEKLSVSPHNLSEVINTKLNQNFFDYVNSYRIDKVKKDLADSGKQNITLLAIAIDAGFNSKSSFNSTFKKFTGMTPTEYKRSLTGI